jgi:hypothetical protein
VKTTIHGQTIQTFRITVEDATGQIEEFDIATELVIGEDLDIETRQAAAKEHFWAQLALDAENDLEEFDKTWYATYCAHTEKFAAYYLKAQGDKNPTGVAKEKTAALLYSENGDQKQGAYQAYQAYVAEMAKVGVKSTTEDLFREEMFKYEDSMEGIERMRIAMKHKAGQLKTVSSAFNTKTWSIKGLAADKRARIGAHID